MIRFTALIKKIEKLGGLLYGKYHDLSPEQKEQIEGAVQKVIDKLRGKE